MSLVKKPYDTISPNIQFDSFPSLLCVLFLTLNIIQYVYTSLNNV